MQELLKTLRDDSLVGDLIRHSRHVQGSPAKYASPREPLEPVLANALDSLGIHRLYRG